MFMITKNRASTCDRRIMDVMKDGALTVKGDTQVYDAIATLISRSVSSLPVVDDQSCLVGMISEKDVLRLLYDVKFQGGAVEDFMTKDVISFDLDDSLEDIGHCFIENPFRRVAILHKGRLISMMDRHDIIEANKDIFTRKNSSDSDLSDDALFTAKDIMTYGLFTVKKDEPISLAVDVILKKNVAALPVVDAGINVLGIISEKDILRTIYNDQNSFENIGEIMTNEVISFNRNDSLYDICDCLINNDFRSVTVLDDGKLVGIISRTDIIDFILKNKTAIIMQKISQMNSTQ